MTRNVMIWVGSVIAAASATWLVVYFVSVGFHPTDTLGVIGAVVGVAGLMLVVYGMVADRRGGQSVTNSWVGAGLAQVHGGENVTIHRRGQHLAGPPSAPGQGGEQVPPAVGDGQSVAGSQVIGPIDQVDGARGNVELLEEP